jgi:hypothetical protein
VPDVLKFWPGVQPFWAAEGVYLVDEDHVIIHVIKGLLVYAAEKMFLYASAYVKENRLRKTKGGNGSKV